MIDHHIQIAQGAEAAAELAAGAGEGLAMFVGEDGFQEIDGGLEAACGDAGLVDGILVELLQGGWGELAEGLDELVHVIAESGAGTGVIEWRLSGRGRRDVHSMIITGEAED
jgi:hypothetical protein